MQTLSTTLAAAVAAGTPQRVLFEFVSGTRQFSNEDVVSSGVKLRDTFVSETDFKMGQCPSAELRFELFNDQGQITDFAFGQFTAWLGARIDSGTPTGKTVTFVEDETNRTYEFSPLGTFIADRPDMTRGQAVISITANDLMTLFDRDMPNAATLGITYPVTIKALLAAMCTYVGVTTDTGNFTNYSLSVPEEPDDFSNATMREVLGWIAACAGANAVFGRNGHLNFRYFTTQSKAFTADAYNSLGIRNLTANRPTGIVLHNPDSDEDISYGTQTNPYVISNNPLLYGTPSTTVLSNINTRIGNLPTGYQPTSVKLFVDDWTIEAGDVIQLTYDSTNHDLPVYTQEFTWNAGGMTTEVQSGGSEKREPETRAARQKLMNDRGLYKVITRVEDAEGNIAELEQTATSISAKVDGMSVGGRNLMLYSAEPIVYSAYSTLNVTRNVSVPEWGATDATRVVGSGGSNLYVCRVGGNTEDMAYGKNVGVNGKNYTISVWIKNNHATNRCGVRINLPYDPGYTMLNPGESMRVEQTAVGNGSTVLDIYFRTGNLGEDFDFTIWHPKIEEGTFATDWTPAPEDGTQEIHNSMVELTSQEFSVTFDEKKVMSVKEDAVRMDVDVLSATGHIDGDVVNTVQWANIDIGEAELPNAKIDTIGKYVDGVVNININGYVNGLKLEGFCGSGGIYVYIKSGAKLMSNISISDCTCLINISGSVTTDLHLQSSTLNKISVSNCTRVELHDLNIRGTGTGSGVLATNSNVYVDNCQIDNCARAIRADRLSHIYAYNMRGGTSSANRCGYAAYVDAGGMVTLEGTCPNYVTSAVYNDGGIVFGEISDVADDRVTSVGLTKSFLNYLSYEKYYGVYENGSFSGEWVHTYPVKAGALDGKTYRALYIPVDNSVATTLNGKTVYGAAVTVVRNRTAGTTRTDAKAKLYLLMLTPGSTPSGNVTMTDSGLTAEMVGNVFVFTLTTAIINQLKSGTVTGFAFRDWNDSGNTSYFEFENLNLTATYA